MDFQGFQNNIHPVLILLFWLVLIVIAFYSYQKQKNLTSSSKLWLGGLRALSLSLVFLLVLNPYFFSSTEVEQFPKILTLVDNSESVALKKGSYSGTESYQSVLNELFDGSEHQVSFDFFTIGASTRQIASPDSLTFQESETNFTEAITQILELENEYVATIILSDGIITFGRNPVLQAAKSGIPIFTIGVGDTSIVRDITINNLVTNPTGYINSNQLVSVEISQTGFRSNTANVIVTNSAGDEIDSQNVRFDSESEIKSLDFQIPMNAAGLKQFSVEVETLAGEWSGLNNRRTFSVDVLDSKIKILHLAFEIHPDVKMLRSILLEDPNVELTTRTWLGGNNFVEKAQLPYNEFDLVIYHGLPGSASTLTAFPAPTLSSSILFDLPRSRRITDTQPELELIENRGSQLFEITLIPKSTALSHPIMELPEANLEGSAPIISSLQTSLTQVDAIVLFNSGFQGLETPNPIVAVLERGGVRRAQVAAWNWYIMYQSSIEAEREFVTAFFANLLAWASNNPDDRRLKINLAKSSFHTSERIIINGNLNNESGEPESNATIGFYIQSNTGQNHSFNLANSGSGTYKLELEALSPGVYTYEATARKGDREIDQVTGEFVVEKSNNELINTVRNDDLLAALANETKGKFYEFNAIGDFWSDAEAMGLLSTKTELVESYHFPVRNFFWFALLLLLLGIEWVLRKNYSLP